ncbi:hypothetical protein SAMN02910398_03762, partial [Butyrivibrio sp. YAB3001]
EMFSKELQILDRNTVKYMIDELQEELDTTKEELNTAHTTIADKDNTIAQLTAELEKYKKQKH